MEALQIGGVGAADGEGVERDRLPGRSRRLGVVQAGGSRRRRAGVDRVGLGPGRGDLAGGLLGNGGFITRRRRAFHHRFQLDVTLLQSSKRSEKRKRED